MQRHRARVIPLPRVRAAIEERADRGKRSRSDSPVKRSDSRRIHGIWIRACKNQELDRPGLCRWIGPIRIRGIVKRLGSPAVPRPAIRAIRDQQFCDRATGSSRSHVQRRVARIQIVRDVPEEKLLGTLACCTFIGRHRCERRVARQTPRHVLDVSAHDEANEIKNCGGPIC